VGDGGCCLSCGDRLGEDLLADVMDVLVDLLLEGDLERLKLSMKDFEERLLRDDSS